MRIDQSRLGPFHDTREGWVPCKPVLNFQRSHNECLALHLGGFPVLHFEEEIDCKECNYVARERNHWVTFENAARVKAEPCIEETIACIIGLANLSARCEQESVYVHCSGVISGLYFCNHRAKPLHPPYINRRDQTLEQSDPQAPKMCFCEVFQYENCALPDDGQHNLPLQVYDGRVQFANYTGYQYDAAWAKQNPGHVPCRTVLLGVRTAAQCRQFEGSPIVRRRPLLQDCPLCNRVDQDYANGHVITWKANRVDTIRPMAGVAHSYHSLFVGKCWMCAKEAHLPRPPARNEGSDGGGSPGNDPPGRLQPMDKRTGATGPPGSEVLKGMGWDKIL
ncbi:hypothetical protein BLS_010186 [Venturia inaequalis]|uniref:Uncharacterized protein n=2 Tax=Venturia inaequalis TaxID=5025 RepID=A0A8H3YJF8_VENIN|nr:hypothetical protein BLS_010186 [Venturia inaequalis]